MDLKLKMINKKYMKVKTTIISRRIKLMNLKNTQTLINDYIDSFIIKNIYQYYKAG